MKKNIPHIIRHYKYDMTLVTNGVLDKEATLYWDEPETNLNPSMIPLVVEVILELEKLGVQVFVATHSYELLKEFELQRKEHSLRFYSLFFDENGKIELSKAETYQALFPNKIADQFARMYDLEIDRAMGGENG